MFEYSTKIHSKKLYSLHDLDFLKKGHHKIGLLGGSFNPAHIGHLHITKQALEKLDLDYVIWLVALQNNLKSDYNLSIFIRGQNALDLIESISNDPRIIVSTLENDLKQNITYEVLKFLHHNFSNIEFTWIMGSDNLQNFHLWNDFQKIPILCKIVIFNRIDNIINDQELQNFKNKFTNFFTEEQKNNIILLNGPMIDISSTKLKAEVEKQNLTN